MGYISAWKHSEDRLMAHQFAVIAPSGKVLTRDTLPPANTKHWVPQRKAEVVLAVQGRLLSLDEACTRYKLTVDEYLSWEKSFARHGVPGLRATRLQDYR